MSDARVRHLLSNLCSAQGARYLEVGCWRGSTLTAALAGNELRVDLAVGVDKWGEEVNEAGREAGEVFGSGQESMAALRRNMEAHVNVNRMDVSDDERGGRRRLPPAPLAFSVPIW